MSSDKPKSAFGKKKKPQSLRQDIEVLADRADEDLLPYVDSFMAQMQQIKPMEEISLLTQEDAKQALTQIDATLRQLNERLGLARSLKQLLETKQRS